MPQTLQQHAAMVKSNWYKQNQPAMDAFALGQEIECRTANATNWAPSTDPKWLEDLQYRVKPTPSYRPYTYEELNDLIGRVIKHKTNGNRQLITGRYPDYNSVARNSVITGEGNTYVTALLVNYTFDDGSPCGVLTTKKDDE